MKYYLKKSTLGGCVMIFENTNKLTGDNVICRVHFYDYGSQEECEEFAEQLVEKLNLEIQ